MIFNNYWISHIPGTFPPRRVTVTRVLDGGVELNWLPPTEPNGEVHYVIEYKREDSGSWTSVNTTSDSTHYNLTELHSGTNYTIRVVAVNSAGRNASSHITYNTNISTTTKAVGRYLEGYALTKSDSESDTVSANAVLAQFRMCISLVSHTYVVTCLEHFSHCILMPVPLLKIRRAPLS